MRRGFLLVAVCMGAGVAGCGDDDDGVIDRPDANIFADGSTIDANHDPDAHPLFGPITVRVYDQDGLLRPGTDVVVNRFEQVEYRRVCARDVKTTRRNAGRDPCRVKCHSLFGVSWWWTSPWVGARWTSCGACGGRVR